MLEQGLKGKQVGFSRFQMVLIQCHQLYYLDVFNNNGFGDPSMYSRLKGIVQTNYFQLLNWLLRKLVLDRY